jgi:hypothetical protein
MSLVMHDVTVRLTQMNCGECGGTYAINERYREQKYKESGFWHCPYCQCSWGYSEGENARLKQQVEQARNNEKWQRERAERANERADQQARRAAAARGQVTKIKRRVANGVCPCCKRTFSDLARHMAGQHPDYAAAPESEG